jgi:hypothetical protein
MFPSRIRIPIHAAYLLRPVAVPAANISVLMLVNLSAMAAADLSGPAAIEMSGYVA